MEKKILIIEDAKFARRVLVNALASGNFNNILEAGTAKEGTELFIAEKPDLYLTFIRENIGQKKAA